MRRLLRSRCGGRRSRRSGYTLIELLVVIAIIGVLIALTPTLERARGTARLAVETTGNAEFARVATATIGLADEIERIVREQRALREPVATRRREPDLQGVRRNLQQLVAAEQRLDRQILPALRRLYPHLGHEDRALARELRAHLMVLRVNARRDIHLKRFLLEGQGPDGRD